MSAVFPTGSTLSSATFLQRVPAKGDSRFFRVTPDMGRLPPHLEEPEVIIKRMTEVPEEVDSDFVQVTTHLVFNPFSLDSMMAAAMLLTLDDGNIKKLVPYDHLIGLDTTIKYESLFLIGVELTEHEFTHHCRNGTSITALAYRNAYSYLTAERRAKFKNMINIVHPLDEFYDPAQAATENCVSFVAVVNFLSDGIMNSRFAQYVKAVGCYTNFVSQPVVDRNLKLPQRKLSVEERLYALEGALRTALYSQDPVKALSELDVETGGEGYRGHVQQTRLSLKRTMRSVPYGPRSRALHIPTISANEYNTHEVMANALFTSEGVVTFEDTKVYRVYRIYHPKLHIQEWVAKYLKPLERWMDGPVLCVATKVPQHDVTL